MQTQAARSFRISGNSNSMRSWTTLAAMRPLAAGDGKGQSLHLVVAGDSNFERLHQFLRAVIRI
jgi:hypothetical protein